MLIASYGINSNDFFRFFSHPDRTSYVLCSLIFQTVGYYAKYRVLGTVFRGTEKGQSSNVFMTFLPIQNAILILQLIDVTYQTMCLYINYSFDLRKTSNAIAMNCQNLSITRNIRVILISAEHITKLIILDPSLYSVCNQRQK